MSSMTLAETHIHILKHYADLSDCECSSPYPIGGCKKCDLKRVIVFIKELEEDFNTLAKFINKEMKMHAGDKRIEKLMEEIKTK